ncbi:MAG: helix-turn-helix transcriptional regulator [Clostridia bacterium]|nr:helix-turn-helix transcriptional regulator [Clostridia bacterium]
MKNNYFGKTLKELRESKNISQRKLGEFFGVANQTISSWEKGINEPDLDTLIKIAEFFEVSTDYLLGIEEI